MGLRLSRDAELDLDELFEHGLRQFGSVAADTYADALLETLLLIEANPRLARERPEIGRPLRLYPFRAHHILYTITDEGALILRVLNHRQDWQNLL